MSDDIQAELFSNVRSLCYERSRSQEDAALEPSASLASRAQAAGVTIAWRTANSRAERQAEAEATNEIRDWAKPIPATDYIAMRQAFAAKFGELEDKHIILLTNKPAPCLQMSCLP